jgi:hypothetical protein
LQGWTTNLIIANWKTKCAKAKRTIKVRLMMWMLSTKEEKLQNGKTLVE